MIHRKTPICRSGATVLSFGLIAFIVGDMTMSRMKAPAWSFAMRPYEIPAASTAKGKRCGSRGCFPFQICWNGVGAGGAAGYWSLCIKAEPDHVYQYGHQSEGRLAPATVVVYRVS